MGFWKRLTNKQIKMPDPSPKLTIAGPGKLKCSQQLQPHINKKANKQCAPLSLAAVPAPRAPAPLLRHTSLPTKLLPTVGAPQLNFKSSSSADEISTKDNAKKYSFKSLNTGMNGVETTNGSVNHESDKKDHKVNHVASIVPALVVPSTVVTRASAAKSQHTMPTATVTAMTGLSVAISAANYPDIIDNHVDCLGMFGSVMIKNEHAGVYCQSSVDPIVESLNEHLAAETKSNSNEAGVKTKKTPRQKVVMKAGATGNADDSVSVSTNDVTTKTVNRSPKKAAPVVKKHMPVDTPLVYFDLETTGLRYMDEIVQIACVCTSEGGASAELNIYTQPVRDFNPMASAVTGLTKRGSTLLLWGSAVPTVPLEVGLKRLLSWLKGLSRPPVLVGHNSKSFDSKRLAMALWNHNLLYSLQASICGFSDTLPLLKCLLPDRHNHKLDSLLKEYCTNSNKVMAHNALHDCRALEQVLRGAVALQPETSLPEHPAVSGQEMLKSTPEAAETTTNTPPANTEMDNVNTISSNAIGNDCANGVVDDWMSSPNSTASVGGVGAAVSFPGPGAACLSADERLERRVWELVVQGSFTVDEVLVALRNSDAAAKYLKKTGS